jgi:hypothetical protein
MLDVLIASPGDATPGRHAVEQALHAWNDHRSDDTGFVLRPRRWEIASVAVSGQGDAQSVINQQLVDESDIVFGLFYNRLGTPTKRAASGTAEEIERSVAAGKQVHLYFADMPRPSRVDTKQLEAMWEFKRLVESQGLVAEFKSEADLAAMVSRAIERDLRVLRSLANQPLPEQPPVALVEQEVESSTRAPDSADGSIEGPISIVTHNGDESTTREVIEPNSRDSEPATPKRGKWLMSLVLVALVAFALAFPFGWIVGRQGSGASGTINTPSVNSTPSPSASPEGVHLINLDWTTEPPEDAAKVQPGLAIIDRHRYENSLTVVGCGNIKIDFSLGLGDYNQLSSTLAAIPKPDPASPMSSKAKMRADVYFRTASYGAWILRDSFSVSSSQSRKVDISLPRTAGYLRLVTEAPCSALGIWADPVLYN